MKDKKLHTAIKRVFLTFFFLTLYLATSIPVGLFLYSLKSDAGIDIFSKTGFHSYMYCLKRQAEQVNEENTPQNGSL